MYFKGDRTGDQIPPFSSRILIISLKIVTIVHSVSLINASSDPDDIKFRLYPFPGKNVNYEEIVHQSEASLAKSGFVKNVPTTVFLIHGFLVNGSSVDMQVIKNGYLKSDLGYNCIIVDWGALSSVNNTTLTIANYALVVRNNFNIVVKRVADFISWLVTLNNLTLDRVHVIGHSLGGQIAGHVGAHLNSTLGIPIARITALDPAGALFYAANRGVQRSDAKFVDIIHTNAGILGTLRTNDGHAHFFANGGSFQPGCMLTDLIGRLVGICSHEFAYRVYAASFTRKLTGIGCPDSNCGIVQLKVCLNTNCRKLEEVPFGVNTLSTTRGQYYLEADEISSCSTSGDNCS